MRELRAEVEALRVHQTRHEERMVRLESERVVDAAAARSASSAAHSAGTDRNTSSGRSDAKQESRASASSVHLNRGTSPAPVPAPAQALPELTVVKLKPSRKPAPALATAVDVVEPENEELAALETSAEPADRGHAEGQAQAQFDAGVADLKTGNLAGGVIKLKLFAEEHRKHSLADNAIYFSALGQMGLEDYGGAAGSFEELIQKYPAGDAVMDAMLKLADCRIRLAQAEHARDLYTKVILNYPGTAAATQAEQRLASLSKP